VPALIWYDRFRAEGSRKHLALSVLFYAFAVLSKETAMALPLMIAAWELLRGRWRTLRGLLDSALMFVPYGVVSAAYLGARVAVLGSVSWKHPAMLGVPDHLIWMTVPFALVGYLRHLLVPYNLSIVYGTSFVGGASDPRFYVPALILAALAALVLVFRRHLTRDAWLALAFMICPLLPVLNLKALHQEYVIQDRYLYLPVLGFAWLVVSLAAQARRARAYLPAALAALAVALGVSTIVQNRVWRDSISLWHNAVRHAPDFWTTHYNLGTAYMDARDYERAVGEFNTSLAIHPTDRAYNNLAMTQVRLGDKAAAERNLLAAVALAPYAHEARNNLGTLLYDRGDYRAARAQFQMAVAVEPTSAEARFNLARASAALGDHAAAVSEYQAVLAKNPADTEARQLLEASRQALAQHRANSN
jgi:tetratricopeptide (TPR) repeat protein